MLARWRFLRVIQIYTKLASEAIYFLHILQHFATKFFNLTNFAKLLFRAAVLKISGLDQNFVYNRKSPLSN